MSLFSWAIGSYLIKLIKLISTQAKTRIIQHSCQTAEIQHNMSCAAWRSDQESEHYWYTAVAANASTLEHDVARAERKSWPLLFVQLAVRKHCNSVEESQHHFAVEDIVDAGRQLQKVKGEVAQVWLKAQGDGLKDLLDASDSSGRPFQR